MVMVKTSKERGFTPVCIEFKTHVLDRLRMDAQAEQRSVAFLVRRIVDQHYYEIDAGRGEQYQQVAPTPANPSGWVQVIPASAPPTIRIGQVNKTMDPPKPHLQVNLAPKERLIAAKQTDPTGSEPEDDK
jgi:hypothetical protein